MSFAPTNYEAPKFDRPNVVNKFWGPQSPGEVLAGTFLGIATLPSKYGPQKMLGLRTRDGAERMVNYSVALDDQVRALKVAPGRGIAIRFDGTDVNNVRGKSYTLALWPKGDHAAMLSMLPGNVMDPASDAPAGEAPAPTEDDLPF